MPFIITSDQPRDGKLYIRKQHDGEFFWTPRKARATRFAEPEADKIATEINEYASMKAEVVGAKPEPAEQVREAA